MKKKGFTLIELVIFMGLMSILLLVLVELFNTVLTTQLESEKTSYTIADGRYILSRLAYDIHRAKSVDNPVSLGDSDDLLELTITENGIDQTFSYSLDQVTNQLTLTNSAGTNVLSSTRTSISNLSFTRLGNTDGRNSVKLMFTVTSVAQSGSGFEVQPYETTIGLR